MKNEREEHAPIRLKRLFQFGENLDFVIHNFSDFSKLSVMNYHVYNQKTNATKLLTCVTDDLRCEGLVEAGARG